MRLFDDARIPLGKEKNSLAKSWAFFVLWTVVVVYGLSDGKVKVKGTPIEVSYESDPSSFVFWCVCMGLVEVIAILNVIVATTIFVRRRHVNEFENQP
ncbi:hypothetical protein [Altererythrobacter sp. Z27]|uniref:hypothetical protein n=1 Tax=Altererythrobacter sp. Z27 TaxID=3461147 RepID=UPI00404404EB